MFSVDEVVIFDDGGHDNTKSRSPSVKSKDAFTYTGYSDPSHFLAHLLSYLETPPYLRRNLFQMHPDLKTAGSLPSLDMPHHSKLLSGCQYREGVTVRHDSHSPSVDTYVDVGLDEWAVLKEVSIPSKTRVTVKYEDDVQNTVEPRRATAVSPAAPRKDSGYYWGYTVRHCGSLSAVFTECSFEGGYDLSFGTSERGESLQAVLSDAKVSHSSFSYQHLILVFGGVAGLEVAAKADPVLLERGITAGNVGELFDYWINILPGQGSRTIRTEEAVWLGLMGLREIVVDNTHLGR